MGGTPSVSGKMGRGRGVTIAFLLPFFFPFFPEYVPLQAAKRFLAKVTKIICFTCDSRALVERLDVVLLFIIIIIY